MSLSQPYVMYSRVKKVAKVGISTDVPQRLKVHRVYIAHDLRLIKAWPPCDDAGHIEFMAHRKLAKYHVDGELFAALPKTCVAAVDAAINVARGLVPTPDWALEPVPSRNGPLRRSKDLAPPVLLKMPAKMDEAVRKFGRETLASRPATIRYLIMRGLQAEEMDRYWKSISA